MAATEDNRMIEVFPTLLQQSIQNAATLDVLALAVGELLAQQRGVPKEEVIAKMNEQIAALTKEYTELAIKSKAA